MLIFLLSVVVLGGMIFAGYRINMYLYSQRAVGNHSRTTRQRDSAGIESLSIQTAQRMAKRRRDEGLHNARIGLAFVIGFVVVLVVLFISILLSTIR